MIYTCRHFKIRELVSRNLYTAWGERCWEFLDPRLLLTLDQLGDRYGAIGINDWASGGPLQNCGLRDFNDRQGAVMSQHKFGRAGDLHPNKTSPQEMHADILKNAALFPELRALEAIASTPDWVHADVRQHAQPQQIWVVNPQT